MKIIIGLLLTLTIMSCKKNTLTNGIGEDLTICFGQKGIINDGENRLEIEFTKLVEDSRCPEGKYCIWEGTAIVEILINSNDHIVLEAGEFVEYKNYKIILLSANFKHKWQQGNEKKYDVTIRVDKK